MHTDLQWPSPVLHCMSLPPQGRGPLLGLLFCPPLHLGEKELMYKVRGPLEKQRDMEEILFSLLQQPTP